MIHIAKSEEPKWLIEYKRKNPQAKYDTASFAQYRSVLKDSLLKEQKYLCAYCCCKISAENSHNEHIEPRNPKGYTSNKSLDYNNILASCNEIKGVPKTCGSNKENNYDESKFVSPLSEACEDVFSYYPSGTMIGDEYTINLLNLNSYKLIQARAAVYSTIQNLDADMIRLIYDEEAEELQPFINVVRWYMKNNSK